MNSDLNDLKCVYFSRSLTVNIGVQGTTKDVAENTSSDLGFRIL